MQTALRHGIHTLLLDELVGIGMRPQVCVKAHKIIDLSVVLSCAVLFA